MSWRIARKRTQSTFLSRSLNKRRLIILTNRGDVTIAAVELPTSTDLRKHLLRSTLHYVACITTGTCVPGEEKAQEQRKPRKSLESEIGENWRTKYASGKNSEISEREKKEGISTEEKSVS